MSTHMLTINRSRVISLTGGRQGPSGVGILRRHDYVNPNDYVGIAPVGSLETDAVWKITRIVVAANGTVTTGVARNVTWTGRAGHVYA